MKYNCI